MVDEQPKKTYDVGELRRLGFSEGLIREALEAQSRSPDDIEPPAALLERLISEGETRLIGHKMRDGTVYAGLSPDTGRSMFSAPADAPLSYTFNEAAEYAKQLNADKYLGHDDWRVPTEIELNTLFKNKALIGGLYRANESSRYLEAKGWYVSSTECGCKDLARVQHFSDGYRGSVTKDNKDQLRCVRG